MFLNPLNPIAIQRIVIMEEDRQTGRGNYNHKCNWVFKWNVITGNHCSVFKMYLNLRPPYLKKSGADQTKKAFKPVSYVKRILDLHDSSQMYIQLSFIVFGFC